MSEPLKPCPFCGVGLDPCTPFHRHRHPPNDCLLSGNQVEDQDAWNRRAAPPVVAEVVKEMREAAMHGPDETLIEEMFENQIGHWADRLEREE